MICISFSNDSEAVDVAASSSTRRLPVSRHWQHKPKAVSGAVALVTLKMFRTRSSAESRPQKHLFCALALFLPLVSWE